MSADSISPQNGALVQLDELKTWKLEDAKSRFSEVVRLAKQTEPQRITVRGEDAVVIISSQLFEKLIPLLVQPSLHGLLSQSPLNKLDFETTSVEAPVREVEF
ncbi:MAG: type II toxin-antitoxin system prevent-host-death family antitoxin [Leptolyngbyaceae cyanobacterium]